MTAAEFELSPQPGGHVEPGIWIATASVDGESYDVPVDLIVPEGAAIGGGRRGARLGPHGKRAARRAAGLETALVDHAPMTIAALELDDARSVVAEVAGSQLFSSRRRTSFMTGPRAVGRTGSSTKTRRTSFA